MNKDKINLAGLINIDEYNWQECININCSLINSCIDNIKKGNISCKYGIPRFKLRVLQKTIENEFAIHNSTGTTFLENICKHLANESTPLLKATHCSLSTAFDTPDTNSAIELEIGRVQVFSPRRDGSTVTINSNFTLTDANTLSTTISSVTSNSIFDLTSVTGLAVGDGIRIIFTDSKYNDRKIQAIAGNQITLTQALDYTPVVGNTANQLIRRIYLIGDGTNTLNTGFGISLAPYIRTKTSSQTINITHTIRFK